jgi:peptidoglycan/LPS O-acetylase OafA/YrhL
LRIGLDAVTDSRNSFIPDPFRWAHHAWFFVVGTWLYRHRDGLDRLNAHWGWRLGLCVPILFVRCRLVADDFVAPLHGRASVLLAVSGALFGWLSLFGLLGLARRVFARPRASIRYLADSSYWIYLVHFPIVGLVQVDLCGRSLPSGWKFATVTGVTLALGMASYQTLVRRTWLGRWLHGPRPVAPPAASPPAHAPACPIEPAGLR